MRFLGIIGDYAVVKNLNHHVRYGYVMTCYVRSIITSKRIEQESPTTSQIKDNFKRFLLSYFDVLILLLEAIPFLCSAQPR